MAPPSGSIIANLLLKICHLYELLVYACEHIHSFREVLVVYNLDRANMYLFLAASAFAVAA